MCMSFNVSSIRLQIVCTVCRVSPTSVYIYEREWLAHFWIGLRVSTNTKEWFKYSLTDEFVISIGTWIFSAVYIQKSKFILYLWICLRIEKYSNVRNGKQKFCCILFLRGTYAYNRFSVQRHKLRVYWKKLNAILFSAMITGDFSVPTDSLI